MAWSLRRRKYRKTEGTSQSDSRTRGDVPGAGVPEAINDTENVPLQELTEEKRESVDTIIEMIITTAVRGDST